MAGAAKAGAMIPDLRRLPRFTALHGTDGGRLPVTVVVPTRGRCPEPRERFHLNPLSQCLDSILQGRALPRQIVIASAATGDHTEKTLAHYRGAFATRGVDLLTLWLPDDDSLGPFGKIRRTLPLLENDFVHMVEDDVILHRDALAGAFAIMQRLLPSQHRLALLNLPVYRRATRPARLLRYCRMGRLDDRLRLTGCFESVFPRELYDDAAGSSYPRVEGVRAHAIDFFRGGNNVVTKEALASLSSVKLGTPYGWEVCAGLHLRQRGFELLHIPYTNLAGSHSFYGADWGRRRLLGADWTEEWHGYSGLSLTEVVRNAAACRRRSGLGPLPLPVYYFRVAACYALILREYRPRLFHPWLRKLHESFVSRLHSDLTAGRQKLEDLSARESVFLAALHAITAGAPWLSEEEVADLIGDAARLDPGERRRHTRRALLALKAGDSGRAPGSRVSTVSTGTSNRGGACA